MKRLTKRATSFFLLACMTIGIVSAASWRETITVDYGVGITVNGGEFVPTDINGNVVNPFIYNGTTYVPLRGVSQALGANVGYDANTATATINGGDSSNVNTDAAICADIYFQLMDACAYASTAITSAEDVLIYSGHIPSESLVSAADNYKSLVALFDKNLDLIAQQLDSLKGISTYVTNNLASAQSGFIDLTFIYNDLVSLTDVLYKFANRPDENTQLAIVQARTDLMRDINNARRSSYNSYNLTQSSIVPKSQRISLIHFGHTT